MPDFLRQFAGRSLRRMRDACMRSSTLLKVPFRCSRIEETSKTFGFSEPATHHVTMKTVAILEGINHRLDVIEEKIDLLLAPAVATKH